MRRMLGSDGLRAALVRGVAAAAIATSMGVGALGCAAEDAAPDSAAAAAPVRATASDDGVVEPEVTHTVIRKTFRIPYHSVTRKSSKLKKGTTKVVRHGRSGIRVKVFRVTLEDGVKVDRELVRNAVRRKPVSRLVLKGTRVSHTRQCDPNYSGACVPIAYDVDCAGGSGDGPAYVQGPVRVIGTDIYDLDRDGDGWGCD